jgi:hypothetical protein
VIGGRSPTLGAKLGHRDEEGLAPRRVSLSFVDALLDLLPEPKMPRGTARAWP